MIDLTNQNHKRGLMVLTSKDVRTVDRTLFDWKVHSKCELDYLELIEHILSKEAINADDIKSMKTYIKFVKDHYIETGNLIDECRKVFM